MTTGGDMFPTAQGYSTPRPDPTLLTTEQLMREISRVEAIIGLQIAAVDERLHAEVKLTDERISAGNVDRETIRAQLAEKFHSVQDQFDALRSQCDNEKENISKSVSTAFASADKAIDESVKLTDSKISSIIGTITSLREMLDERYQTQTKALDAAFVAQQAAVATSFDASEKAMAAALLAAKEAVEKANVSTEKRFDSFTEIIAQLNGTLALQLPRAEAEARLKALDDRYAEIKSAVDRGFTGVSVRHETSREVMSSDRDVRAESIARIAIIISVIGTVLTMVTILVLQFHH